jgi:hypothetical protein
VDNASYSRASSFTTKFRDDKASTIIGCETGGRPITHRDPHCFRLKNSRILCNATHVPLQPLEWSGDGEHGVIPNVPVTGPGIAEFRNEKEPVLVFALHYIKIDAVSAITPSNASSEPAKK